MSEEETDYEAKREDLLMSIERDEEEVRAAVQELANVASERVQELTTVASDKVQELATVTSDTVRGFATAASEKLEVLDVNEHIRQSPLRWLLGAFVVGAWLGVRSARHIAFEQRSYR
ncbi:MAG: hypothetical protein ABR587_12700 [Candidatus Binatia bacterium]